MDNTIALYIMNQKGFYCLQRLITQYGSKIIKCVIVAKDSNVEKDFYNEILNICISHQICWYNRNDKSIPTAKYSIAVGWRWIIQPNSSLLIVFHDSLLPKYRGFAPLVSCLINGEAEIGVTALLASEEYDKGDIVDQLAIQIHYPIKIQQAIDLIQELYYKLLSRVLDQIVTNKQLHSYKQPGNEATYSLWRDDEDYFIDWTKDSAYLKRFIDAVGFPYKGAHTNMNDCVVIILDAEIEEDVTIENRTPGKVVFVKNGCPVVVCGTGLLKITKITNEDYSTSYLPLRKFRTRFF